MIPIVNDIIQYLPYLLAGILCTVIAIVCAQLDNYGSGMPFMWFPAGMFAIVAFGLLLPAILVIGLLVATMLLFYGLLASIISSIYAFTRFFRSSARAVKEGK